MRIKSNFRVLLARKETKEKRTISLREIVRVTGVSISTVQGLANDTLKEYPSTGVAEICKYLDCQLGDLLELGDLLVLDTVESQNAKKELTLAVSSTSATY